MAATLLFMIAFVLLVVACFPQAARGFMIPAALACWIFAEHLLPLLI